jgi:hypothetical protein
MDDNNNNPNEKCAIFPVSASYGIHMVGDCILIVRNIKEYKKADKRQALLDLEHLLDGSLKEKDLS